MQEYHNLSCSCSPTMLQPERDGMRAHAANGTTDSNGHHPSEATSHFADPAGGLSSTGMDPLQHDNRRSHMYSMSKFNLQCEEHLFKIRLVSSTFFTGHACLMLQLSAEAEQQLRIHGKNELEEKHTSKLLIFLKLASTTIPCPIV